VIAAVVPVWNGGADLPRCVEALLAAGVPPESLVIIDDGSTDDVAAVVSATSGAHLHRLQDGPSGPANARNTGAAILPGADVLLFVDADVVVHPDTVGRFADIFATKPDVAAVFGSYDDLPDAPGLISRYKNLVHHFTHQRGRREARTFWAGCGAVRRSAFGASAGSTRAFAVRRSRTSTSGFA